MRRFLAKTWKTWRFLFSPKWLGFFGLCCLFAAVCTGLGIWQFNRHREASAAAQKVNMNYELPARPLTASEKIFSDFIPENQWRPIVITGRYDASQKRIVRNRPLNGRPGYEQLMPFHTNSGQTIIIDRGWLPIGNAVPGHPDPVPDPTAEGITLIARVKPSEPALSRDAPSGQLASIDLNGYADQLPYPIAKGAYGILASENPSAPIMPTALPRPNVGEGPHFSYGVQWIIFATLAFAGFGYGAYQARELEAKAPAGAPAPAVISDEEAEDALLDLQEASIKQSHRGLSYETD